MGIEELIGGNLMIELRCSDEMVQNIGESGETCLPQWSTISSLAQPALVAQGQ